MMMPLPATRRTGMKRNSHDGFGHLWGILGDDGDSPVRGREDDAK
jgi:hypothetical protein